MRPRNGIGRKRSITGSVEPSQWVDIENARDFQSDVVNGNRNGCADDDTIESSSMQISRVNKDEPVALHDQVAAEIRRAIAEGEAAQGERLPPAVDLATVLGVNKNTVIRALHILRDEGLLDFTRGRGVRVVGTPQRGAVMTRIEELLVFARTQGYRREEVVALIQTRS